MLVIPVMMEDWRERLLEAVKVDGRSDRAISQAAKLGVNFVNELRNGKKQPRVDKVIRLANELGLSLGHVFSGADLSAQDEGDLRLFLSLSPESRQTILTLARQITKDGHASTDAPAQPAS